MTKETSPVFYAPTVDAEMTSAMANARKTFKYLWRELTWEYRRIVPALRLASLKAGFGDPGGHPDDVEHMWLGEIEFNGDRITATLLNQPNHVRSVKAGDRVTIGPDEIEDWMYVMGRRVYGGFTIQAMRKKMSSSERRDHDSAWGFEFADPDVVLLGPNWNDEMRGPLDRLFGRKRPTSASDPDDEHPMSEHMAAALTADIRKSPDGWLRQADADGLTTLHSLTLGGSTSCVRVLLENGADRDLRTKSGKTALDLAEQMGWPRIVELLRAPRSGES